MCLNLLGDFVFLQDYMRQAGEVTYADAHKGRKNEGVIEFVSYSDMKRALEKLDGTEVNGRKIRLVEDKPGSRRRRSYSRSRSHSRYYWCVGACCKFINEHVDNPFSFFCWSLSTVVPSGPVTQNFELNIYL